MADTLTQYTPSIRDRLRYALMGDSHDSTRAHFVNGLLKPGGLLDFTPAGIPLNAYDAGRAGASGQYVNSLLSGIAAIPALGPLAGKIAGGVKEARAARVAGQDFKTNAFRVADEHANEITDILSQAHAGANLRSPLPEPVSKTMNIEDIIGPRLDQLGTPSKVAPATPDLATNEIWGKAAQQPAADQPNLSRRGFLGVGAGAAAASVIGLPHFMKPAAEAIAPTAVNLAKDVHEYVGGLGWQGNFSSDSHLFQHVEDLISNSRDPEEIRHLIHAQDIHGYGEDTKNISDEDISEYLEGMDHPLMSFDPEDDYQPRPVPYKPGGVGEPLTPSNLSPSSAPRVSADSADNLPYQESTIGPDGLEKWEYWSHPSLGDRAFPAGKGPEGVAGWGQIPEPR